MAFEMLRRLYFLRHGLADRAAYQGSDDNLRPLTPAGRRRLQRCLPTLRRLDLDLDLVLTSPLARARQTAEIVAEGLGLSSRLQEEAALGFGFGTAALKGLLAAHPDARRMLLVGHEPSFSLTISGLIGGGRVVCKKGSLARVDLQAGMGLAGDLIWLLQPRALLAGSPESPARSRD